MNFKLLKQLKLFESNGALKNKIIKIDKKNKNIINDSKGKKRYGAEFLIIFTALICLPVLFYGCGGGSGASIATQEPGDIYLPPVQTPAYEKLVSGQQAFNIGNYSNAQADFQKSYELSYTAKEKNQALTGIGWSMLKSGSEAGNADTNSVIFILEKIPPVDLYNYSNQEINDARVALALAYMSKSKTNQDFINAVSLLERIDPVESGGIYQSNKFFTYTSRLNHGVTNGQAHAIAAYLYYLQGNNDAAVEHINYASSVSPNDEKVIQIKANLTVLGLFR